MINNMENLTFEECKQFIFSAIENNCEYLERLYNTCGKFDKLIEKIIEQLEEGNTDFKLSDIDMMNTIRINQMLPFFILEDKYENMHKFANAWILILQNFIAMTDDKNKQLEESVLIVAKLLRCEFNFSRLIYLSEMLLNKYEYIQMQANDMESYKLSKLYIDKILNQSDETQD